MIGKKGLTMGRENGAEDRKLIRGASLKLQNQ
jgi:hypothetical protein